MIKLEDIDYMQYVKQLNSSPIFISIAQNFDYERLGLQILNNEEVVKEFTSYNKNGKIIRVEEGLDDPYFTAKIEEETLKEIITNQEWIEKHPIEATIKYARKVELPFIVKLKLLRVITKI